MTGGPDYYGGLSGLGAQRSGFDQYTSGAPGMGLSAGKMMYMNYNQLNTIEEEKHETQNSNYYRDGDESLREDSKMYSNQFRGSKILNDISNDGEQSKRSPMRDQDYNFSQKQIS